MKPILWEFLGGKHRIDVKEFVEGVIQDWEASENILTDMLNDPCDMPERYDNYYDSPPEFINRFTIYNKQEVRNQINKLKEENDGF